MIGSVLAAILEARKSAHLGMTSAQIQPKATML
jgi:hypothetical protein